MKDSAAVDYSDINGVADDESQAEHRYKEAMADLEAPSGMKTDMPCTWVIKKNAF